MHGAAEAGDANHAEARNAHADSCQDGSGAHQKKPSIPARPTGMRGERPGRGDCRVRIAGELGRASLTSVEASEASAAPLGFASDTLAVPPAGEPGRSQPVRTLDEVSDPEREDSIPLGLTPGGGQRDGYLQLNRSEDAQRGAR